MCTESIFCVVIQALPSEIVCPVILFSCTNRTSKPIFLRLTGTSTFKCVLQQMPYFKKDNSKKKTLGSETDQLIILFTYANEANETIFFRLTNISNSMYFTVKNKRQKIANRSRSHILGHFSSAGKPKIRITMECGKLARTCICLRQKFYRSVCQSWLLYLGYSEYQMHVSKIVSSSAWENVLQHSTAGP